MTTTERPQLGEWCGYTGADVAHRNDGTWKRWDWASRYVRRGMFVGYRTAYDGRVTHTEDEGSVFSPLSHQELWLFVENERQTVVKVFPQNVKRGTEWTP